jgi:hypothetical protein
MLPWKIEYFREWGQHDGWNGSFHPKHIAFIDTRLAEYHAKLVHTDIVFETEGDSLAFKLRYG